MSWWNQTHPPKPTLTEDNLPAQDGKVFMITGGYSGIGYHLAHILYGKGAKVYITGRCQSKANKAIFNIRNSFSPSHNGKIIFLPLDLTDLSSVAAAAQKFQRLETRLDVLWNNAGISLSDPGSPTTQSHEPHLGTNCLGPFLLTKLLLPQLRSTAGTYAATQASVRIIWTASYAVEKAPPRGITKEMLDLPSRNPSANYCLSKVGGWFLAAELSRLERGSGIVSLAVNPGYAKTKIWEGVSGWTRFWMKLLGVIREPRVAAYSLLWAGLSEEVGGEDGGRYVVPYGRWHPCPRQDLVEAMGTKEEGGGIAQAFWVWCDRTTAEFAY